MDNIVNRPSTADVSLSLAKLLQEHKALDILIINVGDVCSWTDFFIICTVRSSKHLSSLFINIKKYLTELRIYSTSNSRHLDESGWLLLDYGDFVVHLMEYNQRKFYELEKLWFNGTIIYHSG
jgi:ribosome-associated protein